MYVFQMNGMRGKLILTYNMSSTLDPSSTDAPGSSVNCSQCPWLVIFLIIGIPEMHLGQHMLKSLVIRQMQNLYSSGDPSFSIHGPRVYGT